MSLTDLQALYLPGAKRHSFQRELKLTLNKAQKLAKSRIRKARSKTLATYRRQYFLSSAYGDLRTAISHNEDIFISSILAVFILSYSIWTTALNTLFIFLETAYEVAEFTGMSMTLLALIVSGVVAVICSWLLAFLMNMTSFAVMDGATRKQLRSIRSTARRSLRYTSRVAGAWFALLAAVTLPLFATGLSILIYLQANTPTIPELISYIPYAIIGAASWIIIMLMNYSLVPHVALFEPTMSLSKTFRRSRQLVVRRGRLFILSSYALLSLGLCIAYILSASLDNIIGLNKWLSFSFAIVGSVLLLNGLTATLYRKRKLARIH
jgi:hypothetical protein